MAELGFKPRTSILTTKLLSIRWQAVPDPKGFNKRWPTKWYNRYTTMEEMPEGWIIQAGRVVSFLLGSLRNIFVDRAGLNQCVQRKIKWARCLQAESPCATALAKEPRWEFLAGVRGWLCAELFWLYGCNSPNPQLKWWLACEVCDPLTERLLFYLCSQSTPLYLVAW